MRKNRFTFDIAINTRKNYKLMEAKNIRKLLKINLIVAISLILTGASTYAATRNIDTPNLSFEKGTFENWTRYYGYYGPENCATSQDIRNAKLRISNEISKILPVTPDGTPLQDDWSLKEENTVSQRGYFEVVASTAFDFNLACDNLRLVPEGFGQSMRIGSYDSTEVHYTDTTSIDRKNRAMAERAVYQFEVKENSTLLTLRYAVVMQDDPTMNHLDADGDRPRFSIKVYKQDGTLIPSLECGSIVEYKSNDPRLTPACEHERNREVITTMKPTSECEEWECTEEGACLQTATRCLHYSYQRVNVSQDNSGCSSGKEFQCRKKNEYVWHCNDCNGTINGKTGWEHVTNWQYVCDRSETYCVERECLQKTCKKYKPIPVTKIELGDCNPNKPKCNASHVRDLLPEFSYDGWVTLSYDLRDHIGETIVIDVENRDCLELLPMCSNYDHHPIDQGRSHPQVFNTNDGDLTQTGTLGEYRGKCKYCGNNKIFYTYFSGGYHRTYSYINASTQKMELKIKNCGESEPNAIITAPDVFDTYIWKRMSDGHVFDPDEDAPYICAIPQSEIYENVDYTCTMYNKANPNCTRTVETFRLLKNPITSDFEGDKGCYNEVKFTNLSNVAPVTMANGDQVTNDEIAYQVWSFYDQNNNPEEENGEFEPIQLSIQRRMQFQDQVAGHHKE